MNVIGILYILDLRWIMIFFKYKFCLDTPRHSSIPVRFLCTYSLRFNIEDKRRINEWNVKIFASLFYGL